MDRFVAETVRAIRGGNENDWEAYITKFGAADFLNAAPMTPHLKYFKKFNASIKYGNIQNVELQEDELIILIKTKTNALNLILNIDIEDDNAFFFPLRSLDLGGCIAASYFYFVFSAYYRSSVPRLNEL